MFGLFPLPHLDCAYHSVAVLGCEVNFVVPYYHLVFSLAFHVDKFVLQIVINLVDFLVFHDHFESFNHDLVETNDFLFVLPDPNE